MAMKNRPKTSPPAAPRALVEDEPFNNFEARFLLLEQRRGTLAKRQAEMEAEHPRSVPVEAVNREVITDRARKVLAAPPGGDTSLPATLSTLIIERAVLDRALELAADEGRRVYTEALGRVRATLAPEWSRIVREYALAVHRIMQIERDRDAMFATIGFFPHGRLPLPLSEFQICVRRGTGASLQLVIDAAISAGIISKKEIE